MNNPGKVVGSDYFDIVPDSIFNKEETIALDLGCGTGRWSITGRFFTSCCFIPLIYSGILFQNFRQG